MIGDMRSDYTWLTCRCGKVWQVLRDDARYLAPDFPCQACRIRAMIENDKCPEDVDDYPPMRSRCRLPFGHTGRCKSTSTYAKSAAEMQAAAQELHP